MIRYLSILIRIIVIFNWIYKIWFIWLLSTSHRHTSYPTSSLYIGFNHFPSVVLFFKLLIILGSLLSMGTSNQCSTIAIFILTWGLFLHFSLPLFCLIILLLRNMKLDKIKIQIWIILGLNTLSSGLIIPYLNIHMN